MYKRQCENSRKYIFLTNLKQTQDGSTINYENGITKKFYFQFYSTSNSALEAGVEMSSELTRGPNVEVLLPGASWGQHIHRCSPRRTAAVLCLTGMLLLHGEKGCGSIPFGNL